MSRYSKHLIVKAITAKLNNNRCISKEVQESWVKTIMSVVDRINNLKHLENRVNTGSDDGSVRLDEIMLPTWVKPFLIPKMVTLTDGDRFVDLKARTADDIPGFTISGVISASENIARSYKEKPSFIANLMEEVVDRVTFSEISYPAYMVSDSKANEGPGLVTTTERLFCYNQKDNLGVPIPLIESVLRVSGDEEWMNCTLDDYMTKIWIPKFFEWPARQ